MSFGKYFKKLRKRNNFTQKEIAEGIGKTPMLISGIESGKNSVFCDEDIIKISTLMQLNNSEEKELFRRAAQVNNRIPHHISGYINNNTEIFEILEVLSAKNLKDSELKQLIDYIEENY